jgi:hypothetical protein
MLLVGSFRLNGNWLRPKLLHIFHLALQCAFQVLGTDLSHSLSQLVPDTLADEGMRQVAGIDDGIEVIIFENSGFLS